MTAVVSKRTMAIAVIGLVAVAAIIVAIGAGIGGEKGVLAISDFGELLVVGASAAVVLWVRGALMNMSWPLLNQYSMEGVPGPEKPLVSGGIGFAWASGWLIGSVVGGQLMQLSYTWPYYVTVGFYAAGAALTWLLLGRRRTSQDRGV